MTKLKELIYKLKSQDISYNILEQIEDLLMNKYEITKEDIKYVQDPKKEEFDYYFTLFQLFKNYGYKFSQEEYDKYCNFILLSYAESHRLTITSVHIRKCIDTLIYFEGINPRDRLTDYYYFKQIRKDEVNALSKDLQIRLVKLDGCMIHLISNPSIQLQLEAINSNDYALNYINPSQEVQLEAVKLNGLRIRYIKDPSLEVQLESVKENREAINYIENPHPEVLRYLKYI